MSLKLCKDALRLRCRYAKGSLDWQYLTRTAMKNLMSHFDVPPMEWARAADEWMGRKYGR